MSAAQKGRTFSPEHRENLSAASKGRSRGPFSPEHRARIAAALKGRAKSPEHRENLSAALKGRSRGPFSPEHRENLSAASKGHEVTAETRAKIAAAQKGRTHSPEARARMSAARKGRRFGPRSPETKAKLSAALKGRARGPHSPETRARMSAAQTGTKRVKGPVWDEFQAFLDRRRAGGSNARPAPAGWKPAVKLGRPGKPALVWGKEKTDPTPSGRAVLKVLLKAKAKGLSASEIEEKCGKGGWRETLRRLKRSDADWDSAILFPTKPYRPYRIANAAES
jgi:hypothetical protein